MLKNGMGAITLIENMSKRLFAQVFSKDIFSTLNFLKEHKANFLDPIDGLSLHARALYYAIKRSKPEIVHYLLNLNIYSDIDFFKFCGQTPISLAISEGKLALLPKLYEKTDVNFSLLMAVKLNQKFVKKMLMNDCKLNEKMLHYVEETLNTNDHD